MIFWIFSALLILILIFAILIRNSLSWGWNFAVIAIFLYIGLFKMTGVPREAVWFAEIENIHGAVQIVYSTVIEHQGIYLLVRDRPDHVPFYLVLPYTDATAKALASAKMQAEQRRTPLMADADQLSRLSHALGKEGKGSSPPAGDQAAAGQAGPTGSPTGRSDQNSQAMFWPKPVAQDPLKNYEQTITTEPDQPAGEPSH